MTANCHQRLRYSNLWIGVVFLCLAMLACSLSPIREPRIVYITETPVPTAPISVPPTRVVPTPAATASPTRPAPTPIVAIPTATVIIPAPYTDATYLLEGVCFDALLPIIGNYFMLDSQAALDQFFGTLNVATVCGRNDQQPTFDFSGQVVVGMVRLVQGCTATFIPEAIQRNDATREVVVPLQFEVNPNCDYQLMVSFVAGIPRPPSGYRVRLDILAE